MSRQTIHYNGHYQIFAGDPGTPRMEDEIQRRSYWPLMVTDVFEYVAQCASFRMYRPPQQHQRWMQLFPPSEPLESIVIDIIGSLTKTRQANRFSIVMTDRYSKLPRATPSAKMTAPNVDTVFVEHWIIPYEIPRTILTENGLQIVIRCFAAMCDSVETKFVTTTEYHPQTNRQVEWFKKTLVARLRHYIDVYQTDWDLFVQSINLWLQYPSALHYTNVPLQPYPESRAPVRPDKQGHGCGRDHLAQPGTGKMEGR